MWQSFLIKKNEYAILFQSGDFKAILTPGHYRFIDPLRRLTLQTWQAGCLMDNEDWMDWLREHHPEEVARHFDDLSLGEHEAGLLYVDDLLVEILPPGQRVAFWKGSRQRRLLSVDLRDQLSLPSELALQLQQPALRHQALRGQNSVLMAQIPAYHQGILKVDGQVQRLLPPGIEYFWRLRHEVQVELVDTRLQSMEVSGQEILTRDKVNLRINLAANWQYTDVLQAHAALSRPTDFIYRELQFGLRAAVGTRSLDELLENKQILDELISQHMARQLNGLGLVVGSLGVKDIILPGEMKTILSQVVEAQKAAEANVVRRREETAATRALLNTAKVMEDNPIALRLKELETLERVAERIDRISVFGGLDQVLNGLIHIPTRQG
ncbi:slipin family protein [Zoogloea sp.]|uniref:slipin family protein n=1 Tax=Zoogloea sp. TaxID=49181 RepID=UPI0035AF7312